MTWDRDKVFNFLYKAMCDAPGCYVFFHKKEWVSFPRGFYFASASITTDRAAIGSNFLPMTRLIVKRRKGGLMICDSMWQNGLEYTPFYLNDGEECDIWYLKDGYEVKFTTEKRKPITVRDLL